MSAIGDVTKAANRARRNSPAEHVGPVMWRGRVERVRDHDSPSGMLAGVYVVVPRLTGDEVHGPVPYVGEPPVAGDRVLVAAVEGRRTDLVVVGRINWPEPAGD